MAIGDLADIGMLFVRCKGDVSHNPAEADHTGGRGCRRAGFLRFIENFTPRGDQGLE